MFGSHSRAWGKERVIAAAARRKNPAPARLTAADAERDFALPGVVPEAEVKRGGDSDSDSDSGDDRGFEQIFASHR